MVSGDEGRLRERIAKRGKWSAMYGSARMFFIHRPILQIGNLLPKRYEGFAISSITGMFMEDDGGNGVYLIDEDEHIASYRRLLADQSFMRRIEKDFLESCEALERFYEEMEGQEKVFLDDQYQEFLRLYDDEYVPGLAFDGLLIYGDIFSAEMKGKYPQATELIDALLHPPGITFMSHAELSLTRIALHCLRNGLKSRESILEDQASRDLLQEHQRAFHWLRNNYKSSRKITVEEFAEEALGLLPQGEEALERKAGSIVGHEREYARAVEQARRILSSEDLRKVLQVGRTAQLMDRRKANNLRADALLSDYLLDISRRSGLSYDDLADLRIDEAETLIKEGRHDLLAEQRTRKEACFIIIDKEGDEMLLVGREAKSLLEEVYPYAHDGEGEVKGMVASKGKATGRARIVFDVSKAAHFHEGDILITGMTRPDFVPLMRKAAGIVTDEGGITSHAAIISRELRKPCIIGTKVATRAFKDGEMVEVDAENGVVRRIA